MKRETEGERGGYKRGGENEDRKRKKRGIHGNRLLLQTRVNAMKRLLGSSTICEVLSLQTHK